VHLREKQRAYSRKGLFVHITFTLSYEVSVTLMLRL